ncbi:MAG: Bifunctional diaminohydroxyphosphoribosylaminopyrimidine deaminase/5-amino-6-(5-phosphoribosylamino)uracil reductase RibD [Candidatus Kapaibacterium sp.]|nr:MAG: Bifunctional diaminohydroxyphosphoribosylaminopyrimidine deaminase/5-amino-6-(5-phosphoribosylamino)uracil reductase RibD [Candidatus Kapabacteria bacterium]
MDATEWMKKAIELAKLGANYVHPNPRVGAVIVKDGQIVAEGYHKYFGGPHAEIEAIENAKGIDLEGATLVVTLEPCVHYGKTPPCVDAIIEKKFAKVIVGTQDPNPLVNGQGIEKLKSAGIEVEVGVLERECKWVNRFFFKNILENMPYVILKVAQSLNGAIATRNYFSQWITSEESRKLGHRLRREVDAIIVGKTTALKDNPSLLLHELEGKTPWRVILDTNLTLPLELKVFIDETRQSTIVAIDENLPHSRKEENLRIGGVKILRTPSQNGLIELQPFLEKLKNEFQVSAVLVEGGAGVLSSFLRDQIWDEMQLFVAPKIIPGGKNAFEDYTIDSLEYVSEVKIVSISPVDKDLHIIAVNPKSEFLSFLQ